MATDIKNLGGKVENEGTTPEGQVSAAEWNRLITAVMEGQGAVHKVIYNKKELPVSADGTVVIEPISSDSRLTLTTSDNLDKIVSITGKLALHLRVTSVMNGSDTYENVSLDIQRFSEATGWTSVGTASIAAVAENSEAYTLVDISPFLISGEQQIRVRATGLESNLTAILSFSSIIFTKLDIEFAGEWQRACRGEMPLSFYINGAVSKELHISISGKTAAGLPSVRNLVYSLGSATYPTTPWATTVSDSENDACKVLGVHGVHKVEAWLTCDDGNGGTLESERTSNQMMVVADEGDTTPYLMLQNIASKVQNYVQSRLLEFAVYNPAGLTDVAFVYSDYAGNAEYLRVQRNVASEVAGTLINTIEIEESDQTLLYAYLRVLRVHDDGSESDFMLASTGASTVAVSVDNSENYTPTAGADFVLNPKTRDNSEARPDRILNAARNNAEIAGAVFSGFSFVNDGWVNDADNNKVLRVRAGQSVVIPYECFQDYLVSTANSCTIELDVTLNNITNEEDPIFRICSYVAATGKPLGIEMKPLVGRFLTTSKTTDGEQDFRWQEGVRTHIAFNIVHALRSAAGDNTTLSLVRIFINGVINREFMFDLTEEKEFVNGSSLGIRIGQTGTDGRSSAADIDIYSIRVYRKALGSADCLQDYISSLPTSQQKQRFRSANDILGPDGTVSFAKASGKYNCLVWHGYHTSGHSDADKTTKKGWLEISQLNAEGQYDPKHSGTICKATASLPDKGQGSTAKTYYEWNQQYDIQKSAGTIEVDGEMVPDGWVNGNGEYMGQAYQLMDGIPAAQKLVLKINYASSMQSHKQGATELYNELYKLVVGPTSIQQTEGFENTRVAVIERPFLYFTQSDADTEPVFQGLGTFGPGKMDKKTWGYDKKVFPDFCMLEGSDNNMPLTDMRVPWTADTVKYNPDEEYYEYAGMGNIDFDAGKTETVIVDGKEVERPLEDTYMVYVRAAWNWLFQHNCLFIPYNGNVSDFMKEKGLDTRLQYWMAQGNAAAAQYDLFRYNVSGYDDEGNEQGEWVPAGMPSGAGFATKNLLTMFPDAIPAAHSGQWDKINADFQEAMAAKAKTEFGDHFNIRSAQFHYAFVNQFIEGSDNNSKNTYYVLDPVRHVIELHQDDLDTIFATDNVGWQGKPYYLERDYDEGYYEGRYNVLFDLVGRMYRTELPQMLNSIFSAMASLITTSDLAKGIEASPAGCMQKYFFSIQEYFPAVAYNETARIRYEQAQLAVNKGLFTPSRGVVPITQSLGNQLESERQFIKRRLIYMSSYAAYGEFSQSGSNALSFQGYPNVDGSSCVMKFDVIPHQWLYPTGSRGQTLIDPHVRVAPGQKYTLNLGTVTGDTNVRVCGVNYMRSLGNMGDISVNPAYSFPLSGERLIEFIAEPSADAQFRPSSMTVTAPLMERFSIKGADVGGTLNLTGCTRLQDVDLRGTTVTTVRLPESEKMLSAKLPPLLSALSLANMPNLGSLEVEGYKYMESLSIGTNMKSLDTLKIINDCYAAGAPVVALRVSDVQWMNVQPSVMEWLTNIVSCRLTGEMTVTGTSSAVTFEMKRRMLKMWGDVDSGADGLKVTYSLREIVNALISGPDTLSAVGDYSFRITPATAGGISTALGNNFKSISWSLGQNDYATVDMDGNVKVLSVGKEMEDGSGPEAMLTCSITLLDGNVVTASRLLRLYNRSARVGDYVFYDGTYSDRFDGTKTCIGICWYIDPDDPSHRLAVSLENLPAMPWGLFSHKDYPQYSIDGIELESGYDAYDTPMKNVTSSGLVANDEGGQNGYLSDATYRDESELGDKDGFRKLAVGTACAQLGWVELAKDLRGHKKGEKMPWGQYQTLEIINHRDRVLLETGHEIPAATADKTELQVLDSLLEAIVAEGGDAKYRQFYYPMASRVFAYEPTVLRATEVLADKFRAGNWFLSSEGELARIAWYYMNGVAGGEHGIFVGPIADGIMKDFGSSWFGSSSESYSFNEWFVYFGSGCCYSTFKDNSSLARAVVAF